MDFRDKNEKETAAKKRDIKALLARLGWDNTVYHEFERPPVRSKASPPSERPSSVPSPSPIRDVRLSPTVVPAVRHERDERWSPLGNFGGSLSGAHANSRISATRIGFFSLSGGAGKSTLALNTARLLSLHSRETVLVNCSNGFSLEPYIFPKNLRFGALAFIHPPAGSAGLPVTVIQSTQGQLNHCPEADRNTALFIEQASQQADVMLFDLSCTLDSSAREVLHSMHHIIIPLVPEVQSLSTAGIVDTLLRSPGKQTPEISFVLNKFDDQRSVHRDLRNRLQKTLGHRLLPMSIREEPLSQEAAANGLALVDYNPELSCVADLNSFTKWISSLNGTAVPFLAEVAQGGRG